MHEDGQARHAPRGGRCDDLDLSVVLPCFRAEPVARASVARLSAALTGRVRSWEIIVVDDGVGDCDGQAWTHQTGVRLISLAQNTGKGGAVRAGMTAARGSVRVFTDIDLPFGTDVILVIESLIRTRGLHVVVGDRTFPQSRYATELPRGRRWASAVFSQITASLITGGFFDTQCGLKGLRGDVADALFRVQYVNRFAFDVELLYLALYYGLEIKRIPVVLESNESSSVRLFRDSLQTMYDIGHIRWNRTRGRYASDALESMVAREQAVMLEALMHQPHTTPPGQ